MNKKIVIIIAIIFFLGISGLFISKKQQFINKNFTYKEWMELPAEVQTTYEGDYVKYSGEKFDFDIPSISNFLRSMHEDCGEKCSETGMIEILNSVDTAHMIKDK